jgi:ADP-heptose:LPS heptosyltransferase
VKILLIRLDHLGDILLTTPLVRALARAGHAVDFLVPRAFQPVLEGNPHLHESFALEEIAPEFPARWRPLRDWMRARAYETVLLPNPRPRVLLRCSLGSGAARRLAMQAGIWGRLTLHRCLRVRDSMERGRHFSDLQLDFARALEVEPDGLKPDYFCREDEIETARRRRADRFPGRGEASVVGLHPGCAENTCVLPAKIYGELATLILARTDWRIVLTGIAGERSLLASWPREVIESPRVDNTLGALSLRELAATLSLLNAYVVPSTGPLHLASALGVPTVSPFCRLPPIGAANWGNVGGPATCVEPAAAACERWRAAHPGVPHCDFRAEITAEQLWQALAAAMAARISPTGP